MTAASEPTVAVHVACISIRTLANVLDDSSLHDNVMPSVKAIAPGFRFFGPALFDVGVNSAGYGDRLVPLRNWGAGGH